MTAASSFHRSELLEPGDANQQFNFHMQYWELFTDNIKGLIIEYGQIVRYTCEHQEAGWEHTNDV